MQDEPSRLYGDVVGFHGHRRSFSDRSATVSTTSRGAQYEAHDSAAESAPLSREAYTLHQSLAYHFAMTPSTTDLNAVERASLLAEIACYFHVNGCRESAERLCDVGAISGTLLSAVKRNPTLDLPSRIQQSAVGTSQLFDDDTLWESQLMTSATSDLQRPSSAGITQGPALHMMPSQPPTHSFATVSALVERLVLLEHDAPLAHPPALNFTNAFLETYFCFSSPGGLASMLMKLFKTATVHGALPADRRAPEVQARIIRLLTAWVALQCKDIDRTTFQRITAFAMSISHAGTFAADVHSAAGELLRVLDQVELTATDGDSASLFGFGSAADCMSLLGLGVGTIGEPESTEDTGAQFIIGPDGSPIAEIALFDHCDVDTLADALCTHQFSLFKSVSVRELFSSAWIDDKLEPMTYALHRLIEDADRFSRWLVSMLVSHPTENGRRQRYTKGVRLLRSLFDRQNYHGAQAVLTALGHSALQKLPLSIGLSQLVETADREALEAVEMAFDPFQGNVKDIPWNLQTPCIPAMTPFVGEMCNIHETHTLLCRDDSGLEHVNWSMMAAYAKVAMKIRSYQRVPYVYRTPAALRRLMASLPGIHSDDTLMDWSVAHGELRV